MWSIFRVIGRISQTRKLSTTAPWMMLPPSISGGGGGDMAYNFCSLRKGEVVSFKGRGGKEEAELFKDEKTRLVGSSHGWLALSNDSDLFLLNPLTGRRIKLPVCEKPPSKVIVSCPPEEYDRGGGESCVAMMIYGPEKRLATCHPGRSHEWTSIGRGRSYTDLVYSTTLKRFLCISKNYPGGRDLQCWDVGKSRCKCFFSSPRMDWNDESLSRYERVAIGLGEIAIKMCNFMYMLTTSRWVRGSEITTKYLVFADGLYLVTRIYGALKNTGGIIHSDTAGFLVHKINRGGKSRFLNRSTDGLVMFVGINHSFALPASQYPELKPNSIYFTGHNYACDTGIYHYDTATFSPYHSDLQNVHHTHTHTPLWYTPDL